MTELKPAPNGYAIKLVRDNTPEIINSTGEPGELFYASVGHATNHLTFDVALKAKLMEEVTEFLLADGDGLDELTDVIAVVDALAYHKGSSLYKLMVNALDDPRGGFKKGLMMYGRHPEFDK